MSQLPIFFEEHNLTTMELQNMYKGIYNTTGQLKKKLLHSNDNDYLKIKKLRSNFKIVKSFSLKLPFICHLKQEVIVWLRFF